MEKCIVFNGYKFKTLKNRDPNSFFLEKRDSALNCLEPGWQISPATPDALHVCAAYPWAAHALVLADESAYCTALAMTPGTKTNSFTIIIKKGGKCGAVDFSSFEDDCFADVLICRKLFGCAFFLSSQL